MGDALARVVFHFANDLIVPDIGWSALNPNDLKLMSEATQKAILVQFRKTHRVPFKPDLYISHLSGERINEIGVKGSDLAREEQIIPRIAFDANFVDPFLREVGDVQVRLEGDAMSLAELNQNGFLSSFTHEFEVVRVEGRPPDIGDYEVVGEVKNNSGQSVTHVLITVMLFDSADNLLGAVTHITPDKYVIGEGILLAPGETTTFKGWFGSLAEGGDVARIEVGFEGEKTE